MCTCEDHCLDLTVSSHFLTCGGTFNAVDGVYAACEPQGGLCSIRREPVHAMGPTGMTWLWAAPCQPQRQALKYWSKPTRTPWDKAFTGLDRGAFSCVVGVLGVTSNSPHRVL